MSKFSTEAHFYTSLACICIVQDQGIVSGYLKYYLQRDTKMSQNQFQDEVKILI
jgi:hypothetical protein